MSFAAAPLRRTANLASSRSKCLLPPAANLSVRPCKRSAARSRPLAEGCFSLLLVASPSARLQAGRNTFDPAGIGGPKPPRAEARSFGKHARPLQASARAAVSRVKRVLPPPCGGRPSYVGALDMPSCRRRRTCSRSAFAQPPETSRSLPKRGLQPARGSLRACAGFGSGTVVYRPVHRPFRLLVHFLTGKEPTFAKNS